jgi:hypothetical protein
MLTYGEEEAEATTSNTHCDRRRLDAHDVEVDGMRHICDPRTYPSFRRSLLSALRHHHHCVITSTCCHDSVIMMTDHDSDSLLVITVAADKGSGPTLLYGAGYRGGEKNKWKRRSLGGYV